VSSIARREYRAPQVDTRRAGVPHLHVTAIPKNGTRLLERASGSVQSDTSVMVSNPACGSWRLHCPPY